MSIGHRMGPPLCGMGNGKDGDKLLCNKELEECLLEDEEEGEVDLEGELRSALEEIDRLKLKCRK